MKAATVPAPLKVDFILERGDAGCGQRRRISLVERVAIAVGCRNVEASCHQRFVLCAEIGVAIDAGPTEMGAVITLFQAQEFGP